MLRQNRRGAVSVIVANVSGVDRPDDREAWPCLNVLAGLRSVARHSHSDVHGGADEVTSGGASFVPVMQAADLPESDHVPLGDTLHASGRWRVFRQREMRSRSVIVRKIVGQDSAQVLLAEYHDVVQATASD